MRDASEDRGATFPSTRWSRLVADPAGGSVAERAALDGLARSYERPIRAWVRTRWSLGAEEAREATQDFFLWVLESGFLARADPARGSFRGFVKRALANFLVDRERVRRARKRGGDAVHVPLVGADGEALALADPAARSADDALDALWRRELLARANAALEAECRERGRELEWAVFADRYLADDELDYRAIAARHGISTTDVSNRLQSAKTRWRAHLRTAVLETVRDDVELRAEMSWLISAEGA